jgi:hypothetical protein
VREPWASRLVIEGGADALVHERGTLDQSLDALWVCAQEAGAAA